MRHHGKRFLHVLMLFVLVAPACRERGQFGTPSETFYTYHRALERRDTRLEWACYTDSYRTMVMDRAGTDGYRGWAKRAKRRDETTRQSLMGKQVVDEKIFGSDAAYLVLEPKEGGQMEFMYLMKVENAWKITSFLDEHFREAVEDAVRRGAIGVPR